MVRVRLGLVAAIGFLAGAGLSGCEVDSASGVTRQVDFNVDGVYREPSGGPIVAHQSGAPIRVLTVRQNGDQLEAFDNHNVVWRGRVADRGLDLSFSLKGTTTAGRSATFAGRFILEGGTSTMEGTWVEDDRFSTFFAQASVVVRTNRPPSVDARLNPENWQGCCSSHDGLRLNVNGQVVLNGEGYAVCNDGTRSPTCNIRNR
ncbi:MAG TPA: hypothetical protein PKE26_12485 [Kiritimatiellia bacterium]|nr:hypothetical protein [Kiritimatiellia bacterium]HMO99918.1 hypothetical protein [Kiritimatiellia bacterium]